MYWPLDSPTAALGRRGGDRALASALSFSAVFSASIFTTSGTEATYSYVVVVARNGSVAEPVDPSSSSLDVPSSKQW